MSSKTAVVAAQYRLQEWAAQIKDCQNRPAGMSVADWCTCNGITKANYYYRLRRVRAACLENLPKETLSQQMVLVEPALLQHEKNNGDPQTGISISRKGFSIHVTESTSMSLLAAVLEVIRNAE